MFWGAEVTNQRGARQPQRGYRPGLMPPCKLPIREVRANRNGIARVIFRWTVKLPIREVRANRNDLLVICVRQGKLPIREVRANRNTTDVALNCGRKVTNQRGARQPQLPWAVPRSQTASYQSERCAPTATLFLYSGPAPQSYQSERCAPTATSTSSSRPSRKSYQSERCAPTATLLPREVAGADQYEVTNQRGARQPQPSSFPTSGTRQVTNQRGARQPQQRGMFRRPALL